ncbi:unnamed protein product [Echinostoma caproni]|uniref:Mediator of RNA polymerase II transcription subunit 8 n=1 Tax=Echinostoma caproni TaxID=27848 RepID=A0A183B216_9TREM|nr:unnamed protein product [Echinostoma caproni]
MGNESGPRNTLPIPEIQPPARAVGTFVDYSQWIPSFSDKISPLMEKVKSPSPEYLRVVLEALKKNIENATATAHYDTLLIVETNALDIDTTASLSDLT